MFPSNYDQRFFSIVLSVLLVSAPISAVAQGTKIQTPKNKYSLQDDIQLGRQAAGEVKQQMPILPENSSADDYVELVGNRLIGAIPPTYQTRGFRYSFDVVNASDINAFALPGGPMFVNRGMIEAAKAEGEMAGVMAHEIAHVVLRHGTAQATRQSSAAVQLGAIGSAILGAIIGGNAGGAIAQGAQIGLGAYLMKYSREYETQADIVGAQILARAGYDPRDLASMFKTIEEESGNRAGAPEWLSSHPNPGNRYERINREATLLRVERGRPATNATTFRRIQEDLRRMPKALTMQQIAQEQTPRQQNSQQNYPSNARIDVNIDAPSTRLKNYNFENLFALTVPVNWRDFPSNNSVSFIPEGAYGNYRGQAVFTHGAIAGVVQVNANNLQMATNQYIGALLRENPYLQVQGNYQQGRIEGRTSLGIALSGRSNITGKNEYVAVRTAFLGNGLLFYFLSVAPTDQQRLYQRTFSRMLNSVRFR